MFCLDSFISCFGLRFKHIILSSIAVIFMSMTINDHGKKNIKLKYYDGKKKSS
jgi:hypothetical protein